MGSDMLALSPRVPAGRAAQLVRRRLAEHAEVVVTTDYWGGGRLRLLRQLARKVEAGGDVETAIEIVGETRHGYLICWPAGQPPVRFWRPGDGRAPTSENGL